MQSHRIEGICLADLNADCAHCALNDRLLCNFEPAFAHKFSWLNFLYRLLGTGVALLAGILTGQWWLAPLYIVAVAATFLLIEPRLLCSHCPFYAREGRTLDCWALRGMPKFWRYRPEPISLTERRLMVLVGGFIDLFPFLAAIYGIVGGLWLGLSGSGDVWAIALLIIATVGTGILGYYLNGMLQGDACKRCPNFSCAMNKTPEEVRHAFLAKNPTMARAWGEEEVGE